MATFVPYQVDYKVENKSKTIGFSKKKVSFKFGIASNQALGQGLTGANCRGSEHEIIFVWSLNSGKRQILADGKEVHFSESGLNGWTTDQIFQHPFALRVPNFSSTLRCHLITQPANPNMPGSRPFDLRLNGASFFQFNKIFQLGTPQMIARPLNRGGGRGRGGSGGGGYPYRRGDVEEDPYCTPEERKAIAHAKLESLKEFRESEAAAAAKAAEASLSPGSVPGAASDRSMKREEASLISFDDPTPPAPAPPAPGAGQPYMSSLTLDPALKSTGSFDLGGPQPPGYPGQHHSPGYPGQQQPPGYPGQQPYGNYALGAPPQQQPPPQTSYLNQPPQQQPPSSNALTPYQQQPGQPQPYYQAPPQQQPLIQQQNSFGSGAPAPSTASSFDPFAAPAAPSFAQKPPTAPYGAPPAVPPAAPSLTSPSNQTMNSYHTAMSGNHTVASYGSAPTFAQPPQQQQPPPPQQQQQYYQQQPPQYAPQFAQPPPPQGYPQPY